MHWRASDPGNPQADTVTLKLQDWGNLERDIDIEYGCSSQRPKIKNVA